MPEESQDIPTEPVAPPEPERVLKGQFHFGPPGTPYFHYRKPEGFDDRDVCGAQRLDGSPCQNPAKACEQHCGAWAKAIGRPCAKPPMRHTKAREQNKHRRTKGRCALHGGKSPAGMASPHCKGMGYSTLLPQRLVDKFVENAEDPEILSLREEIALLRVRAQELASSLQQPVGGAVSGEHWGLLKELWKRFTAAMNDGKIEDAQRLATEVGGLINGGMSAAQTWEAIQSTVERISMVAFRESRRIADQDQTMTAQQAITLVASIMRSIRTHVADKDSLRRISDDMHLLLNKGDSPVIIRRGPDPAADDPAAAP